jgi:hypothetical protein
MAAKQPLAEQVDVSKYKSGGKGCVGSEGGGRLGRTDEPSQRSSGGGGAKKKKVGGNNKKKKKKRY